MGRADPAPSKEHAGTNEAAHADRSVPFFKLFSFAFRLDVVLMLVGSVGATANGVSMPLIALLLGQVIDAFGETITATIPFTIVALRFIYVGIGSFIASFSRRLYLLTAVLSDVPNEHQINILCFPTEVTCWMIAGERQAARIPGFYLKAILRQDVAFFDMESATGEVVGRMAGDTILIQDAIGEKVSADIGLLMDTA
ncbi:hypothetical protein L7F22_004457 [Adiantum nelumboides]|nr:hypothetical protein [Adiantum nelumboides]